MKRSIFCCGSSFQDGFCFSNSLNILSQDDRQIIQTDPSKLQFQTRTLLSPPVFDSNSLILPPASLAYHSSAVLPKNRGKVQQIYPVYNFDQYEDMQQTPQSESRQAGRWTKEEHQRFMYAIMQYGKDWKKVEQYVMTRSGSQVRSHAQKFFNKLQKGTNTQAPLESNSEKNIELNRRQQEFSETEFDIERQLNHELTPSTPMELVTFIKKQTKEAGGKINLTSLKKTLQQHQQHREKPALAPSGRESAPQVNSFKSMSNFLSAYEEINDKQDMQQDESFFISITKKYKRLFRQVQDFDRLIDLHNANEHPPEARQSRKRSFTIPEGNDMADDQLDEKIEEIKKKINTEAKEVQEPKQQQKEKEKEKRERKDSESSIQFMMPPLNRLSTIQEHPREDEEQMSYKALISQSALQDPKSAKQ